MKDIDGIIITKTGGFKWRGCINGGTGDIDGVIPKIDGGGESICLTLKGWGGGGEWA